MLLSSTAKVFEHEVGLTRNDLAGSVLTPFAETGPLQVGQGERIAYLKSLIPDEDTLGDVSVSFKSRYYPTGTETTHGPYTLTNPTSIRLNGRQIKMKLEEARVTDWRVGAMRVDVVAGGTR